MPLTFIGGTHMDEHKGTCRVPIEQIAPPKTVAIPMRQHIGAPCGILVSKGDYVKIGQVIGDTPGALCCPVHASVSGTVISIEARQDNSGGKCQYVVIENDFEDNIHESIAPQTKQINELDNEEIITAVRKAGIVGMGGAAFPTYAKIQSAIGKARRLVVNCAECEPYITSNHRLLLERPEDVINGTKILIKVTGVAGAIIAVEDNKMDAVRALEKHITDKKLIDIKVVKTKYPQGDERQLIFALFNGIELPAGKLPADVGCVIFNAETAASVYNALNSGMPVVKKIVTVSGDAVKTPSNLLVPVGTSFIDAINHCGGFKREPQKIVSGGPMMGIAQWDVNTVITRSTGAVLAFSETEDEIGECIRCGRCVKVCQMHLMPVYLGSYSAIGDFDACEKQGAMSCVECGCCTYVCPGKVPIVQYIRNAKGAIIEKRNRQKAERNDKN